MWWIVWDDGMGNIHADAFDHEPSNDDMLDSWSTGYYEVDVVEADSEEEAIEQVFIE